MGKCIREIKLYVCYGILVLQELVGFVVFFFLREKRKEKRILSPLQQMAFPYIIYKN